MAVRPHLSEQLTNELNQLSNNTANVITTDGIEPDIAENIQIGTLDLSELPFPQANLQLAENAQVQTSNL